MNPVAKMLIIGGMILVVIGPVWAGGSKVLPLRPLPGDIVVEKENFRFYFPIVTCIAVSVVLSLIMYLIRLFSK